jgi:cyclophilin family peptidyl-prolyl cis-trans isomerase
MSVRPYSALVLASVAVFGLAGCNPEKMAGPEGQLEDNAPAAEQPKTYSELKLTPSAGDEVAIIETGKGKIVIMFYPERAPKTVENFKKLARDGFYEGVKFHRVIPGFMIQGGDPLSKDDSKSDLWGTGGTGNPVPDEFNDIAHLRGVVSMANSGTPGSQDSQFFIVQQDSKFLDNKYSAFGRVVSGIEVVDAIVNTPTKDPDSGQVFPSLAVAIKKVTIAKWPIE